MLDNEKMPDVLAIRHGRGELNGQPGQERKIPLGKTAARFRPPVDVLELNAQHRALDSVHSIIVADLGMVVAPALSVIAKGSHAGGESVVIGDNRAGFAE